MDNARAPIIENTVHQEVEDSLGVITEWEDEEEPTEAVIAKAVEDRRTAGLFKKGISGNPAGRPKGKSLKEWGREYLAGLTDEERYDFFNGIAKIDLWKMIEGNPSEDKHVKISVPVPILGGASQLKENHEDMAYLGGTIHTEAAHAALNEAVGDTPPMPQS